MPSPEHADPHPIRIDSRARLHKLAAMKAVVLSQPGSASVERVDVRDLDSIGVGHADGGCAELVAIPATQAFVLAESFPRGWDLGQELIEPSS